MENKLLIESLLNYIDELDNKLKIAELKLGTIHHLLTSEITSKRYGEIKSNENE